MVELTREYSYRRLFPLTHDQFLEEPASLIDWLLQVDLVYKEVQNGK